MPSTTVATSPTVTGRVPRRAMTIPGYSSTSLGLPDTRIGVSVVPRLSRPSGVFTFSVCSPNTTSSTPMPSACNRTGSSVHRHLAGRVADHLDLTDAGDVLRTAA